jgi:endonuclease YncB( thermonuclease family)
MQVYLSKGGKQYGPYAIGQLRQYVESGNFSTTDYACHDGKNWITVADVPGIASRVEVEVDKPIKKSRNKFYLVIGVVSVLTIVGAFGLYLALSGDAPVEATSKDDIFSFTPQEVVSIYDGDTFKVDLAGVHPLFGDDVSIRLHGVDTPEIRGSDERVKALVEKARDLTAKALQGANRIELKNPQRGKYFRIVAEVYVDGDSLAELLTRAGLAKAYDGEGPKPAW